MKLIILIAFSANLLGIGYGISKTEFLSLKSKQNEKLVKFKKMVNETKPPHEYMKEDLYLLRYLRHRNFDVHEAMKNFQETLKWRKQNNIDNILQEDFSLFAEDYKAYFEGCDREGRPVLSLFVGDWDVRRAVISGNGENLTRFAYSLLESASIILKKMQDQGDSVVQATMIWDFDHFNPVSQACLSCIPVFVRLFDGVVNHYPLYLHKLYSVNVSPIALQIYNAISPLFPKALTDVVENHDKNKARWAAHLGKEIDPSQLSTKFGGTREEEGRDIHDIVRETIHAKKPFKCFL